MATVAPHELDPADLDSISPEELERQWAKVAIETGQLLARHNIQGTPVSEVTDALAEAKVHNRPVRASELILHISAGESPMPDLKEIAHMRLFLANAYPGIELESLSPLQLRRICDIIPPAALAKKDEFHHRARPNLDSQLQRLQRYLAGESDAQISADESVSATAIALGRNTLAKNIGKLVSFDDLTDAASAQLLNAIAANREPSLEDVITGIRDGTIEEEEPKVFDYEPSGELVFPQNFDAEVVTFLNTSRTNVHINEIIWTFFGRRLETPEYLEVRKIHVRFSRSGVYYQPRQRLFRYLWYP